MKFLKKWGILIVSLLFIVVIVTLCLIGVKSINTYKDTIEQQNNTIASLEAGITAIGDTTECYVVNQSVRVGQEITEDMLSEVTVPLHIAYSNKMVKDEDGNESPERALSVITSPNEVVGKQFRVSLDEGAILLSDFVQEKVIDNTDRYYQLVVDNYPTDIQLGDYVDLRIQFTYGEDFIAIPHCKIEAIDLTYGLFTFIFDENDIAIYNSMLLDKAMYSTVNIYMLKYVDTTSQTAAESYYPVNKNISEILTINPNILEAAKEEMMLERAQLNAILGGDIDTFDERALTKVQQYLDDIRQDNSKAQTNSIKQRVKDEAAAAKERAKAEAKAAAQAQKDASSN